MSTAAAATAARSVVAGMLSAAANGGSAARWTTTSTVLLTRSNVPVERMITVALSSAVGEVARDLRLERAHGKIGREQAAHDEQRDERDDQRGAALVAAMRAPRCRGHHARGPSTVITSISRAWFSSPVLVTGR